MSVALIPLRPIGLSPGRPTQSTAVALAKGVVIDPQPLRALTRDETGARKDLALLEVEARKDIEFVIATARTELRRLRSQSPSREHREQSLKKLSFLVEAPSPPRVVEAHPEHRAAVLAMKPIPKLHQALFQEEAELREWVAALEAKLRDDAHRGYLDEYAWLTRLPRLEDSEQSARDALFDWFLSSYPCTKKQMRLEQPWYSPVVQAPVTFEGSEQVARMMLEADERKGRQECHDFLVLRYGVLIYSVNRVEVVERYDIEEEFDASLSRLVSTFFRMRYRTPLLAMAGTVAVDPRTAGSRIAGLVAATVSEKFNRFRWPWTGSLP